MNCQYSDLAFSEDEENIEVSRDDEPHNSDADQEIEESPGAGSDDQGLTEKHEHDEFPPEEGSHNADTSEELATNVLGDQDISEDSLVDDPEGEEQEVASDDGDDQEISEEEEQHEDSLVDDPQPTITSRYHQHNLSNLPHPELDDEAVDVTAKMSVDERKGDAMKDDSEAGAEEDDISSKEAAKGEDATNSSTATEFVVWNRAMTRPSPVLQVGKTLAYEVTSASSLEDDVRRMKPKTMVSQALTSCDWSDPQIILGIFPGSRRSPIIPYKARVKKPPDKTMPDDQEEHGHEEGGVWCS